MGFNRITRAGSTGRAFVSALAAGTVLVSASAASARVELGVPAERAQLTIGCMFPMTGRSGIYGRDSVGGMRVALAELEKRGNAPALRILVEDDRSKASYAVRIADGFIRNDGARVLCGVVSSGVAQAVSALAQRRKVVFIGTDHASSRMTVEGFHRYYFRVSNDTHTSMAAGARYLAELQKKDGWTRLAFVGADYDYGHVSWQDLESSLAQLGVRYQLVAQVWPKLYEPDYSVHIAALRKAKPDIVVAALWGGDFIGFLKQSMSAGLTREAKLANFDTGGNYDTLTALDGQAPQGLILSARHHNNWPDTARNRAFVESFHAIEGRYPTYAAEGAYTGILAVADALRAAGPQADTEALVDALEHLRLELPEDPDGFVSHMDPDTHQLVQMQAIGEPVPDTRFSPAKVMLGHWTVYPAEALQPSPDLVRRRRAAAAVPPMLAEPAYDP